MSKLNVLVICPTTPAMDARLHEHFVPHFLNDIQDRNTWFAEFGETTPYIMTDGHLGVPAEIQAGLPNLKAASSYGVGYDAIDMEATCGQGIPVSHTPDVLNAEVATTAMLLYLSCYRNFEAEIANARSGSWEQSSLPMARSAHDRKVGILGLGRIGEEIAQRLIAFGCEVHYHNRSEKVVSFNYHADLVSMAQEVDALISVVPGGPATDKLIDAKVMAALGPDGVLVNVGRGSTVDEAALITALETGALGWAGLDVFEAEPHIPERLRALPNVILTPHIGSATVETRRAMGDLAIDNLIAHKDTGKMKTPVPEASHL